MSALRQRYSDKVRGVLGGSAEVDQASIIVLTGSMRRDFARMLTALTICGQVDMRNLIGEIFPMGDRVWAAVEQEQQTLRRSAEVVDGTTRDSQEGAECLGAVAEMAFESLPPAQRLLLSLHSQGRTPEEIVIEHPQYRNPAICRFSLSKAQAALQEAVYEYYDLAGEGDGAA